MLHLHVNRLRLLARNEGKLKAQESCNDLRAWSHDINVRNQYLRDWMRCDMPFCVLPMTTLTGLLRCMTRRSCGKTTPRCHPDCKSKILLESICNSCYAMKDCFKDDKRFEKYFFEEDFETSQWPCERCLEALKCIKMLWKIITEKVLHVKIPKVDTEISKGPNRSCTLRDVSKMWEEDLLYEAQFMKSPQDVRSKKSKAFGSRMKEHSIGDTGSLKIDKSTYCKMQRKIILTQDCISVNPNKISGRRKPIDICTCTSTGLFTCDIACDCTDIEYDELNKYKNDLEQLRLNSEAQNVELSKLKKENSRLKSDLQNFNSSCKWKSPITFAINNDTTIALPKPYERIVDITKSRKKLKEVDSEVIITMKKCQNESFRHISLLQVIHKSNNVPCLSGLQSDEPCYRKEDPFILLNKVQNSIGTIMKREMMIARDNVHEGRSSDIVASFQRVSLTQSEPSHSTMSLSWSNSASSYDSPRGS